MIKTLSLMLPVLLPSWRFFKTVEPSPRVQWAFVGPDGASQEWLDFRPRPLGVTPWQMVIRLFWNAARNDALFVVSCAERIEEAPSEHSITEITRRIQADLASMVPKGRKARFRLVFVSRDMAGITRDVLFISAPFATS